MYSFERFAKSKWSLVVISGDRIIFRSKATAIKPLIRFLKTDLVSREQLIIYDKYIGRAAALLMALVKPIKVYTPVVSEGGRETLEQYGISYHADRQVKYLMGIASDDMCKWEKMTVGKSPEEFRAMLAKK